MNDQSTIGAFEESLNTNPKFLALPPAVQVTIRHSGVQVTSDTDLENIYRNFLISENKEQLVTL